MTVAVAIAIAGCGGSSHATSASSGRSTTSSRIVAAAAAKTSMASTAQITETVRGSLRGSPLGHGSLHGVVDGRKRRADVTFDFSFLAQAEPGVSGDALKGRGIFYGQVDFVTGPAIVAKLGSRRRWVELTDEKVRESGGLSGGLSGASSLDPTKPVDHLRAVTGNAEKLGSETVGGARTTHYRTKVDFRRYISLLPPRDRAAMTKAVDKLETALGTSTAPVEAWIDGAGTIRRVKGLVEGPGVHLEYTLDLHGVGNPVKIKPPPASQVADARHL